MKIISHREESFPNDLEGKLNAVLNVVNTELKTITLLHLDDRSAEASEIRARIRETVGKRVWLPQWPNFRGYCQNTFVPIGTVAEEQIVRENDETFFCLGYSLTEAGRRYGLPIAAFTLDYVTNHNISMHSILGSTSSRGGSRAPLNRINLLEKLRIDPQRITDLSEHVGIIRSNILTACKTLGMIGFLTLRSVGETKKDTGFIIYKWKTGKVPEEVPTYMDKRETTRKLAQLLYKYEKLSPTEAAKLIDGPNVSRISAIFSFFVERDLAERDEWIGKVKQSEVKILDKGRNFLTEYVDIVRDVLDDESKLKDMQVLYERLVVDQKMFKDYAVSAIKRYKSISRHINYRSSQAICNQIVSFLIKNPGARPREIMKAVSLSASANYLTPLIKAKVLKKDIQGKKAGYYVNE